MSEHAQSVIETSAAVTSVSTKATVGAAGVTAGAKWLGLDPITFIGLAIGIGGLIVSIFGFLVNWHYKREENKRELAEEERKKEIHRLQMQKLMGMSNAKEN